MINKSIRGMKFGFDENELEKMVEYYAMINNTHALSFFSTNETSMETLGYFHPRCYVMSLLLYYVTYSLFLCYFFIDKLLSELN